MKETQDSIQDTIVPATSWSDAAKNLAFLVLAFGVAYFVTVRIGLDDLRATVASAGIYAPLLILLLKATTIVAAPLGGVPLYPIAGALFGFWQGLAMTLAGDTIGSSIAFFLSRRFGRSILHFFTTKTQLPILEKVVARLGNRMSFIKARIFFSGYMDIFAYAAGLTSIPFWFFITTHIAIHSIPAALYTLFGNLLVSGSWSAFVLAGVVGSFLAVLGVVWFRTELSRGV